MSVFGRNASAARRVQRFFARRPGPGLILPDGWVGRPFDNQYELTRIDAGRDALTIELGEDVTLELDGRVHATETRGRIELAGFDRLIASLRWHGDPPSRTIRVVEGGVLAFAVPEFRPVRRSAARGRLSPRR